MTISLRERFLLLRIKTMQKKIKSNKNSKRKHGVGKPVVIAKKKAAVKKLNPHVSKPFHKEEEVHIKIAKEEIKPACCGAKSFWRVRSLVGLGFVLVAVFAVLSIVAFGSRQENVKSRFVGRFDQAATLSLADNNNERIVVAAVGDILLARFVELKMRSLSDYLFPFRQTADLLKAADITIGNLETPLFPGVNTPQGSMTFRGDPEGLKGLVFAGFDAVTLANNHIMNFTATGLLRTLNELKKTDILFTGAGMNQDEAHTPAVIEAKGKKIAIYAYNDQTIPPGFHGEAVRFSPGIAKMNVEAVKNDVKNALSRGADFVVVSMHAGREYSKGPTQIQRDFAHAAIDAGASIVMGHHPHVVQPVEEYGSGVIFYSLGNFVFDQFFSEDVRIGLVAQIVLEKGQKPEFALFPTRIQDAQPRFLEGEAKEAVLKTAMGR